MSMSTSYRYEVENPSAKTLKKALQRQEQRIRVS
jgi:phosphoribosylformylglycinamidine (FGAM) synthase PurS component